MWKHLNFQLVLSVSIAYFRSHETENSFDAKDHTNDGTIL